MTGGLLAGPQGDFYLACALILLAVAVFAVVLKPMLALWALAVLFAAEQATPVPLDASLLRAGGTHVYPFDVLSVVMLLATVIFLIRRPPPARIMVPLSVAGAVFAINLCQGISEFGLRHATNESREWLYFVVTTAFVVAAGPWGPRFWRPWFALAAVLVGLAWLGLAEHGLHSATAQIVVNGQFVDSRPLTSGGALVLAFALIVMLGTPGVSPRRKLLLGAVLLGTIILVQQRTVWAVLAVAFLIWAAASLHRRSTAMHRRLAAVGSAFLAMLAVILAGGIATGNVFDRSLTETTARHSTLAWRVIGWSDLLHSDHSLPALALGQPFGSGYRRVVLGAVTNVAPHSFYIAGLLRLGVVGLIALALLYWNVWKFRRQSAAALGVLPLTVALLLAGVLVTSFTYELTVFSSSLMAGLLMRAPQHVPERTEQTAASRAAVLLPGVP